jgi:hypothetical protein
MAATVILVPNNRAREKNLYRFDGTLLSDIELDIYLETFMSPIQTRFFMLI